jgi:hypothetical protein
MGVVCLFKIGDTGLAHKEGAPDIDLLHQVPALYLRLLSSRYINGAGVIYKDIYTAEVIDRLLDDVADTVLESYVALYGQHFASSSGPDVLCGGKNGPFQLGIGLSRLARYGDIRTFFGQPDSNGLTNAPGAASDKDCLIGEAIHNLVIPIDLRTTK